MPKVKGKDQLCSCERYKTYFKSIQGLGGHTLFDRYNDIENIVNKQIDEKYRHFLAQPEIDGDTIHWFSKPYSETPQRLSELQGEKRVKYDHIKNETLAHYKSVIDSLRNQRKISEADALDYATKFVNDDFIYCCDNQIVLGIWGMELRNEIREPLGVAMKNSFIKKKKLPVIDEPPIQEEDILSEESTVENVPESTFEDEEQPENPYNIRFNAGDEGDLRGQTEYSKYAGETITTNEVPQVVPKEGYEFIGWDKNPNDYRVTDDMEFTAQYREIPPTEPILVTESWWSRFWGVGTGCLNWLLLLLLLALIFMVIWCCLLGNCNFNFCGCDCEETTVVIPDPKPVNPNNPTVSPCDAQVKSGGDEGYVGIFEMGQPSGSFVFEYNTENVPDKITIYEGSDISGKVIFTYSGSTSTLLDTIIQFNKPTITVEIISLGNSTYWAFKTNCP